MSIKKIYQAEVTPSNGRMLLTGFDVGGLMIVVHDVERIEMTDAGPLAHTTDGTVYQMMPVEPK